MINLVKKMMKKNKNITIIFLSVFIFYIISYIIFAINIFNLVGIETILRIIILLILLLNAILYFKKSINKILRGKYKKTLRSSVVNFILSLVLLASGILIGTVYNVINNIGESSTLNYTSKLIKLNETKFNSSSVIGMIENTSDIEGYILSNIIMVNENLDNEIVYYESYIKLLYDLYKGDIDAAFVQNNYVSLYESEEELDNLFDDTEVIYSFSATYDNNDKVESTNKTFDEPLTFLIMGIDSTVDGIDDSAAFNGDTLMLITFNPDTLNATMFSLPRDLMVPIACNNNAVAKINSAAAFGTACVVDTIENLIDIKIDYYIKINFNGVIDLVDALGGIEVDVETPDYNTYDGMMCEQDSQRRVGEYLICLNPGLQTLNGEEALAYSRNRKLYKQSDIDRIAHQQQVVTAIANKALTISNYSVFESLLSAIQKNIVTNMTTTQILSSYNVFKNMISNAVVGGDFINIEKSYLQYYDLRVYMPSYGMETAGLGYYKDSLENIIDMMNINLGNKNEEIIKTFSYENGEVYESLVAGEGYYGSRSYEVLTDFTSMSQTTASNYCSSVGIKCTFVTVESDDNNYNSYVSSGLIANQSIRKNTLLNNVSSVTLYVNAVKAVIETVVPETEEDYLENDNVLVSDE